jgi:formylglycine-generating enzyme required for sulfatase activity
MNEAVWYKDNSGGKIHPVGEKKPNALNLHDMSGNVMEWCWDWLNSNHDKNYGLNGWSDNRHGDDNHTNKKMRRGGCYLSEAPALVLNFRGTYPNPEPQSIADPRTSNDYVGLRIVTRD